MQPADVTAGWPLSLPQDRPQPWEELDGNGLVIPADRVANAINQQSAFIPGVERFNSTGDVTDNGEASRITSAAGSTSQAMYRIPLGGGHPGVVSVDANLLSGSGYYVGLANYGSSRWSWHGPFSDNHVRISTALQGPYTSSLGNMFLSVLVHGGSSADIVGIGVNTEDTADTLAPLQPAGLAATPVQGGLLINWDAVIAGDLAGYRIYYSKQSFVSPGSAGVKRIDSLEGQLRHQLSLAETMPCFVRISAVDISGNESALSDIVSAAPLAGSPPVLIVGIDKPSAGLAEPVILAASGAGSYDFDIDGDGSYDVTGSTSGTVQLDTSRLGIIRPHVRATGVSGTAVANGGVSLVITGNTRPVASALASPQSGDAPLPVDFTGVAEDAEDEPSALTYAWDLNGDGIYEAGTNMLAVSNNYLVPGIFGVKFRVTDSDGAWDVDTVPVLVTGLDQNNLSPSAALSVNQDRPRTGQLVTFDALGSSDPDGSIVLYEWDFNGDGVWDGSSSSGTAVHSYSVQFGYLPRVRVTDNKGATDIASLQLASSHGPWTMRGHDTLHSGRSPYVGAQTNNKKWSYPVSGWVNSSPAIAADGTVYVGSEDYFFYAVHPDGSTKWSVDLGEYVDSTPAIAADGTIYVGSDSSDMYAINPDGSVKWSYPTGNFVDSSPAIAADGTIYVGCNDSKVYALNPDGTLRWTYTTGGSTKSSPAIALDGTVYIGSNDFNLYALNPDGTLKWAYSTGNAVKSSPAIGADGTVYVGSNDFNLYALNADGNLQWTYTTGNAVESSPAIGADGTVYVGSRDGKLYAVNPDGSLQWFYTTGNEVNSSPAVGADGTVYVGSYDNFVYAISNAGSQLWSYDTGANVRDSSPAIGSDGRVYIGGSNDQLFAFGP
jgi:outer membrane protein assembly factor BamB